MLTGTQQQALKVARSNYYRGWTLSHRFERPVSGRWVAERQGVEMCHGEREGLCSMIDQRHAEARDQRDKIRA